MPEEEKFAVYLMDREGKHQGATWLDIESALDMVRQEMKDYYEVRITDESDFMIFKAVEGRIIFPSQLDIIAYHAQNEN